MRGTGWWRFLSLLHPRNAPWPSPAPGTLSDDCTLVAIDGVAKPFTTAWSPMCFFDRPLLQCACRRLPQYVHAFQRASFLPAPSCLFFLLALSLYICLLYKWINQNSHSSTFFMFSVSKLTKMIFFGQRK